MVVENGVCGIGDWIVVVVVVFGEYGVECGD